MFGSMEVKKDACLPRKPDKLSSFFPQMWELEAERPNSIQWQTREILTPQLCLLGGGLEAHPSERQRGNQETLGEAKAVRSISHHPAVMKTGKSGRFSVWSEPIFSHGASLLPPCGGKEQGSSLGLRPPHLTFSCVSFPSCGAVVVIDRGGISLERTPLWQRETRADVCLWHQPGNSWPIALKIHPCIGCLSARHSVQKIPQLPPKKGQPGGHQMLQNTSLQRTFHIQTVTFPKASLSPSRQKQEDGDRTGHKQ